MVMLGPWDHRSHLISSVPGRLPLYVPVVNVAMDKARTYSWSSVFTSFVPLESFIPILPVALTFQGFTGLGLQPDLLILLL